jgi:hypothetical protein
MKTVLAVLVVMGTLYGSLHAAGDLVICIDTSGSMRFPLAPTATNPAATCADMISISPDPGGVHPPETRYRTAHTALFDIVGNLLVPMADEGPVGAVHLVRFPDYASAVPLAFSTTCSDNPFENSVSSSCVDIYDSFLTTNLAISCVHGTPLKSGLEESNKLLYPPAGGCPPTPGAGKMILLICDGEPTDGWNKADVSGDLQNRVCDDVEINAIGIGNYASNDYFSLLHQIATKRNGDFFGYIDPQPPPGVTPGTWPGTSFDNTANILAPLDKIFMNTLGYQSIVDPGGALAPGEQSDFEFAVTSLDTGLVFAIHWDPGDGRDIAANIVLPDSTEIPDYAEGLPGYYRVSRADGSIYFLFFNDLIRSNLGEWRLSLSADDDNPEPVEYNYSVYTRSPLVVDTEFARTSFKTGEYFSGKTRATLWDKPVKDIAVEVSFVAPTNWRGDWNSRQKLSEKELMTLGRGMPTEAGGIASWAEDTPLIDRKCAYLQVFRGQTFIELFDDDLVTRRLYDDGRHNDGMAGDGEFNSDFLKAVTPGMYQVLYTITGTTAEGVPFRREHFCHSYVDVNVEGDWEDSNISFKRLPSRDRLAATRVSVEFIGKTGHRPLPGKAGIIRIVPEHGSVDGPLVDRLDGTYTQEIVYDPRRGRPNVSVMYGRELFPARRVAYIPRWQIMAYAGPLLFDGDLPFTNPLIWGIKIDRYLSERWALEGVFGMGKPEDDLGVKGTLYVSALNAKLFLFQTDHLRPFVAFGVGHLQFRDFTTDDDAFASSVGAGLNFAFSEHVALGVEATDYVAFDLYGEDVTHNLYVGGGVVISFF